MTINDTLAPRAESTPGEGLAEGLNAAQARLVDLLAEMRALAAILPAQVLAALNVEASGAEAEAALADAQAGAQADAQADAQAWTRADRVATAEEDAIENGFDNMPL